LPILELYQNNYMISYFGIISK